jgi:phosphoadenosine phosphosulfate reductase
MGLTDEEKEDYICEKIFQWWISGKSYDKWFAEEFLQQKLNFDE